MSVVKELLRGEQNGSISFGDYTLDKKAKLDNFEHGGDIYKVKTFYEITKLEKNGLFVYESVPGSAVTGFTEKENGSFLPGRKQQGYSDHAGTGGIHGVCHLCR